jgi:hypothetical protein
MGSVESNKTFLAYQDYSEIYPCSLGSVPLSVGDPGWDRDYPQDSLI